MPLFVSVLRTAGVNDQISTRLQHRSIGTLSVLILGSKPYQHEAIIARRDSDRLPVPEYYLYGDEEEYPPPVPKRMRSIAGDWPTSMPLDSPSPHAL